MTTLAAVFMSLVTLAGILAAPWIVNLMTAARHNYEPEQIELMVTMTRIMYPFILLVSLAALAMGILNAKNVFGMPALSSCFFNLGSMIGGAAIGYWMDPAWGPRSLIGFSIGVVIGGLAQLGCQFPALWRVGYRFAADFQWRDPGVRQILRLMGPAVISSSVVQVNVVVNTMFALKVGEGAASWLSYAFRVMQLPIGVFGVAVATVTLPALSRAAVDGISDEFRPTLAKGLRLVAFLVVPSALGLAFLAEPIISVLFERVNFRGIDRIQTAAALRAYGYGLVFYAALKVLQPAFYAIDKRWFPMMVSFLALAINLGLNYLFVVVLRWGHESLALTTSISASVNFLLLYLAMRRFTGDLGTGALLVLFGKLLVAGALMAGVCMMANRFLFSDLAGTRLVLKIIYLGLTIGVASGVYFVASKLMRVSEAEDAMGMIMRKLGK
jgi:putative peptidoglycan lipid II flippase